MEQLLENVKSAFLKICKFFKEVWESVKKALFKIYSVKKEFRELNNRYIRTKKKRTKKKYYKRMMTFIVNNPIRV